ncbi:MAG: hypothetical protein DMG90_17725 [Acidobacteria bacterium]|nr:MAG: hypothetical protein DMG90_17725 [Acidobacteriota bacterium]
MDSCRINFLFGVTAEFLEALYIDHCREAPRLEKNRAGAGNWQKRSRWEQADVSPQSPARGIWMKLPASSCADRQFNRELFASAN